MGDQRWQKLQNQQIEAIRHSHEVARHRATHRQQKQNLDSIFVKTQNSKKFRRYNWVEPLTTILGTPVGFTLSRQQGIGGAAGYIVCRYIYINVRKPCFCNIGCKWRAPFLLPMSCTMTSHFARMADCARQIRLDLLVLEFLPRWKFCWLAVYRQSLRQWRQLEDCWTDEKAAVYQHTFWNVTA